jgi:hypothetical protein
MLIQKSLSKKPRGVPVRQRRWLGLPRRNTLGRAQHADAVLAILFKPWSFA